MRWRYIAKVVGWLTLFFGLTMAVALLVAIFYRDRSVRPLLFSMLTTIACGGAAALLLRREAVNNISQREAMAIVALGWTATGLFGALPFLLGPDGFTLVDAVFESVSGVTTTGASIITDIESMPPGLLFWRSFIQWLGGMGIIVLSLAVLPFLKSGGMQLFKAEVPSPVPDKLKPRVKETAVVLWKVYILFTAAEILLLAAGGMGWFDAVCHSLTTLPTGGFSPRNTSIAHYDSAYFDTVFIIFMLLAGINFSLHYQLIRGKPLSMWRDAEFRFFLGTVVFLVLLVSFNVYRDVYQSAGQALRYGAFQVVSILTTTGYATADYEKWPFLSQLVLLLCMFAGASAGSTGGGMKLLRVMLLFKYSYRELFCLIHPHSVVHVKIGGRLIPEEVVRSVIGFIVIYMGLFAVCCLLLAALGVDLITTIGAVAACIGNIGPGLGLVGPTDNFAGLPAAAKWLLSWCMLLGRLEVYTVIIFLVPEFYRK